MRERLLEELGDLPHARFLVYLMGPYTAFDVEAAIETTADDGGMDPEQVPEAADFGALVGGGDDLGGGGDDLGGDEAVMDLLLHVRDRLRTDPGVNAFLAVDVDVPLEEMDAATQSVEFALASNAVVYVVPKVGDNLGVGIEVGAVLEALYRNESVREQKRDRVLFVHESGVRSAMIGSVQDRWDAQVYAYDDREDLVDQVRLFVRNVARRELRGDLPRLDANAEE